jgi:hypothetical protein
MAKRRHGADGDSLRRGSISRYRSAGAKAPARSKANGGKPNTYHGKLAAKAASSVRAPKVTLG